METSDSEEISDSDVEVGEKRKLSSAVVKKVKKPRKKKPRLAIRALFHGLQVDVGHLTVEDEFLVWTSSPSVPVAVAGIDIGTVHLGMTGLTKPKNLFTVPHCEAFSLLSVRLLS